MTPIGRRLSRAEKQKDSAGTAFGRAFWDYLDRSVQELRLERARDLEREIEERVAKLRSEAESERAVAVDLDAAAASLRSQAGTGKRLAARLERVTAVLDSEHEREDAVNREIEEAILDGRPYAQVEAIYARRETIRARIAEFESEDDELRRQQLERERMIAEASAREDEACARRANATALVGESVGVPAKVAAEARRKHELHAHLAGRTAPPKAQMPAVVIPSDVVVPPR